MSPDRKPDDFDLAGILSGLDDFYSGKTPKLGPEPGDTKDTEDTESTKEQHPYRQAIAKNLMGECIGRYLHYAGLKPLVSQETEIRNIARYFTDKFKAWQNDELRSFQRRNQKDHAEVVKEITLFGMANFAQERLDEASRAAGRALLNSPEHRHLQETSNYWAWTEQVIREAAEQEKKNP